MKLSKDLSGWDPLKVRVRCVQDTASREPGSALIPDFLVADAEDSPMAWIANGFLKVTNQRRLENPNELEFMLSATGKLLSDPMTSTSRIQVRAALDTPSGAAGAIGAAAGIAGGGIFGGIMAGHSAAQMLSAVCTVEMERPVFSLSIEKFRWAPALELPLSNLIDPSKIAELNSFGGLLIVPVVCNPTQESQETILQFSSHDKLILLHDVSATLDWIGQKHTGEYKCSDEATDNYANYNASIGLLTFTIPPPGDPQTPPGDATSRSFTTSPLVIDLHPAIASRLADIHHGASRVETELSGHHVSFEQELLDFNHGLALHLADRKSEELKEADNSASFNTRLINLSRFFQQVPTVFMLLRKSFLLRAKVEEAALAALTDLSINCMSFGLENWRSKGAEARQANTFRELTHKETEALRQEFKGRAIRKLEKKQKQLADIQFEIEYIEKRATEFTRESFGSKPFLSPAWEEQMLKFKDATLKCQKQLAAALVEEEIARRSVKALDDKIWQVADIPVSRKIDTSFQNSGLDQNAVEFGNDLKRRMQVVNANLWEDFNQWEARIKTLPAEEQAAAALELERVRAAWKDFADNKKLQPFTTTLAKEELESLFTQSTQQDITEIHDLLRRQQQEEPGWGESLSNNFWAILQPTINAGKTAYQKLEGSEAVPVVLLDARRALNNRRPDLPLELAGVAVEAVELAGELAEVGGTLAYGLMCSILQMFNIAIKSSVKAIKFVMDAVIQRLEISTREVTNLPSQAARNAGVTAATAVGGLPSDFFTQNQKDRFLADFFRKIRPDSDHLDPAGDDPTTARSMMESMRADALSQSKARSAESPRQLVDYFRNLLSDALEPNRISEPLENPSHKSLEQLQGALTAITVNIKAYERAFKPPPQQALGPDKQGFGEALKSYTINFYEEAKKVAGEALEREHSWANIDNYLRIIGNNCAQLARIVAWGLSRYPTRLGLAAKIRIAAEAADNITSLVRVVLAECAMKPNIDAFAYDLIAYQGLAWKILVENSLNEEQATALFQREPLKEQRLGAAWSFK